MYAHCLAAVGGSLSLSLSLSVASSTQAAPGSAAAALAESGERIVLVRDGVTAPRIEPGLAADALRERIRSQGPQRLIVGLRVGVWGTPPLARPPGDERARRRWDADVEAAKAALRVRLGARLRGDDPYRFQPLLASPFVALEADAPLLAALIDDEQVVSINTESSGPAFLDTSVDFIGGLAAHTSGYTGNGYAVAVIDSGVSSAHAMFSGKVVSEACYSTPDPGKSVLCASGHSSGSTSTGAGGPCSVSGCSPGHGGHVAGVAVGASVAPGGGIPALKGVGVSAGLVAIQSKAEFSSFPPFRHREADVASALGRVYQIASTHGVAAVNLSFGLSNDASEWSGSACDSDHPTLVYYVDLLELERVMVVAAAGNKGRDSNFNHRIAAPACLRKVVSVGATARDWDSVMPYSSTGANLDLLAPGGADHRIPTYTCGFADRFPGGVWSAYPFSGCSYMQQPGTSQAAPHVAGAAALLRQRYPQATPSGLRDLLKLTGSSFQFTHGGQNYTRTRIDVAAALTPPSAPSAPTTHGVNTEYCYGAYELVWTGASGTITEYQVESSSSSGFATSQLAYVGQDSSLVVDVASTTYFRVRACNTVSCSAWKNGSSAAVPLNHCL